MDRLQQLLLRVRATASERGIALPRDLPEGALAEHLRRKRLGLSTEDVVDRVDVEPGFEEPQYEEPQYDAFQHEQKPPESRADVADGDLVMVESTKSERGLTAFPDGEARADHPLALVPPPIVRAPPARAEYTTLPTSPAQPPEKPALVQFTGHFDEEETSTGDASAIEALALEEERLAREAEEQEIVASGLLDDGVGAPRSEIDLDGAIDIDDDVEILEDDAEAGTDPPGPTDEANAPVWAAQPPSDDFERAVVRFASSAPRAPAAPLELEDLDDLASQPPPVSRPHSQPAVSSSSLFDVADIGSLERAQEESHAREVAESEAPEPTSSPRPVGSNGERDGDLALDSVPPESGEAESQPYPKSVRQTSEPDLHDPYASHGVIDDGLSEPPPATMHTVPVYDDEPTPRPVQAATTEMRSLGSVDVQDRTRVGEVEAVAIFEPRRNPAPTHFGAILDQALSLLKPS